MFVPRGSVSFQLLLMARLLRRRLLSRREAVILLIALAIEITRMLTVDLFMLVRSAPPPHRRTAARSGSCRAVS